MGRFFGKNVSTFGLLIINSKSNSLGLFNYFLKIFLFGFFFLTCFDSEIRIKFLRLVQGLKLQNGSLFDRAWDFLTVIFKFNWVNFLVNLLVSIILLFLVLYLRFLCLCFSDDFSQICQILSFLFFLKINFNWRNWRLIDDLPSTSKRTPSILIEIFLWQKWNISLLRSSDKFTLVNQLLFDCNFLGKTISWAANGRSEDTTFI